MIKYFYIFRTGKTDFVIKLCKNADYMMTQSPDKIIYCYSVMQDKLQQLAKENPKVELHEGFSSDLYLDHDSSIHSFLIIDDLMSQDIYCELADLFTKYSRHHNISVAFLTQNVYNKSAPSAAKCNRTILINSTEVVFFR